MELHWAGHGTSALICFRTDPEAEHQPEAKGGEDFQVPTVLGIPLQKTTPDQQLMLLMEDGPQALLAGAMALGGQLSKFTALVNLILPSIRLLLAWLLHESIARRSMDWLLYDAWRTEAAGQALLCEQRLTGLAQRKGHLRFTAELWRAVLEDLNLGSNSQFDQSYTMPFQSSSEQILSFHGLGGRRSLE